MVMVIVATLAGAMPNSTVLDGLSVEKALAPVVSTAVVVSTAAAAVMEAVARRSGCAGQRSPSLVDGLFLACDLLCHPLQD
jgi:hypothetical protein